MSEQLKRVRRLVPRQDEVNRINDQSSQQYALPQIAATDAPPLPEFLAFGGLTRNGQPAQTEHESKKTKQQKSGRKFREQRAAERETESEEGATVRRSPHLRESPDCEQAEKRYGDVRKHQRPEYEKRRRAHVGGETQ